VTLLLQTLFVKLANTT